MSSQTAESLGYKLMGIYAWLQAIWVLSLYGQTYFPMSRALTPEMLISAATRVLGIVLMVFYGWYLMRKGERMAASSPDPENGATAPLSETTILSIGFCFLGVNLIASSIPQAVNLLQLVYTALHRPPTPSNVYIPPFSPPYFYVVGVLVQLGLGIGLFLRARDLAEFWWRRMQR